MTDTVDKIARAVLYEGYLLYPYRPSAVKNQQRWNFGVLYPPAWAAAQKGDRSYFRMECIAQGAASMQIEISLRFLKLFTRHPDGREWQEAAEQRIDVPPLALSEILVNPFRQSYTCAEPGKPVEARVEASAVEAGENSFRVTVQFHNDSKCEIDRRDEALIYSLASAHAVLQVRGGCFLSQTDPPPLWTDAVAQCRNVGVWPVLAGDPAANDMMLGSPIILYDYPQVAPESSGDLFDGTEIDEILTLRILTLSDPEKQELRRSDPRARLLLERLESSVPEQLLKLHGVIRGMHAVQETPWSAWDTVDAKPLKKAMVEGVELGKGDRVRLRPCSRADIFDTYLDGKTAIIEAVEEDFENRIQFAVIVEDDPGRDLGEMRQAGHRFFFSAEEIEPLVGGTTTL